MSSVGLPPQASAAIIDCRAPAGSVYVVFLSEPQTTPEAFKDRAELLRFMDKLQFELDQGSDGRWVHLPHADVRFASCVGRRPALDGQDFADKALIETLYNQSVLLEVWGSVDAERTVGVRANATAQMNYLLVPLRYAADQREATLSGILRLTYPKPGTPPTGDFLELLARPQDLDALIAAALGYKALRERRFDVAQTNLCQAASLIASLEERLTGSRPKADAAALRQFVIESAGRAVAEGKKAGTFKGSTLMLHDIASPCADAGGKP